MEVTELSPRKAIPTSVWLYLPLALSAAVVVAGCARPGPRAVTTSRPIVEYREFGPPIEGVSLTQDVQLGPPSPLARGRTARFFTYVWNRSNRAVTISTYWGCYDLTLTDATGSEVPDPDTSRIIDVIWLGPGRTDWVTLQPDEMIRVVRWPFLNPRRRFPPGEYTAEVEIKTDQFVPHEQDLAETDKLANGVLDWDLWQPATYDPARRALVGKRPKVSVGFTVP